MPTQLQLIQQQPFYSKSWEFFFLLQTAEETAQLIYTANDGWLLCLSYYGNNTGEF